MPNTEAISPLVAVLVTAATIPLLSSLVATVVLSAIPSTRWTRQLERESAIYSQMPVGPERDEIGAHVELLAARLNSYRDPKKGLVWKRLRWVPVILTIGFVGLVIWASVAANGFFVLPGGQLVIIIGGAVIGVTFTVYALATGFAEPGSKVVVRKPVVRKPVVDPPLRIGPFEISRVRKS